MVKTALSMHFAAKQTPTQRFNSVMSSQLHVAWKKHFNSYTQPLINLVSAHILACVRICLFYTILCRFSFCVSFTKLKRKNTLIFKMQLCCNLQILCSGRFKDFSRPYGGIQGLFKDFWQPRTFQGFTLKFKDFSRLCEPCRSTIIIHIFFNTRVR